MYPGARQWRIWRMAPRTFCPCQHEFNPVGTDGRGADRGRASASGISVGSPGPDGGTPGSVLAHGRQVTPPNTRPEEPRDGLDFLQADDFPKSGVDRGGICLGSQDPRGLFQQLLI